MNQEPFRLDVLAKKDFLEWTNNQFPNIQKHSEKNTAHPEIESRFKEVNEAAMTVLDLLIDRSTIYKKKAHRKHMINLSFAFEQKNTVLYTKYLSDLLEALND